MKNENEIEDNLAEDEEQYELTPEQATNLDSNVLKPVVLNRKRLMRVLSITFAVLVAGGVIYNLVKTENEKTAKTDDETLANTNMSSDFISGLRDRAVYQRQREITAENITDDSEQETQAPEPLLPPVTFNNPALDPVRPVQAAPPPPPPPGYYPPPPQAQAQTQQDANSHYKSSLVPPVQGSLFAQARANVPAQTQPAYPGGFPGQPNTASSVDYFSNLVAQNPYGNLNYPAQVSDYAAQNDQSGKQSFFAGNNGAAASGQFLGENSLWTGTVITGVLETAINTDLPGHVLARVTQNVYDSQTGRRLLIPQGTLLLARYNSSVSYAQKRVQIVWDTLIRPDGFEIDLGGAGGIDRAGMSGQVARYSENWFLYLKAAGIVSMFSIANARMTETAAKYATEESTANIAAANVELVNQISGQMVGRAMNVQPTLTVDNGTVINIMLNKTIYLPPVANFPATQKYILE